MATAFDDRVHNARHLSSDRGIRFSLQVGVASILCDVALIFISKAVFFLSDRNLRRHPERATQARIAEFGELGLAAESPGLTRGQVEPAEFQELSVMPELAQITGFSENGECIDRADAGNLLQQFIIACPFSNASASSSMASR